MILTIWAWVNFDLTLERPQNYHLSLFSSLKAGKWDKSYIQIQIQKHALFWDCCKRPKYIICQKIAMFEWINDQLQVKERNKFCPLFRKILIWNFWQHKKSIKSKRAVPLESSPQNYVKCFVHFYRGLRQRAALLYKKFFFWDLFYYCTFR